MFAPRKVCRQRPLPEPAVQDLPERVQGGSAFAITIIITITNDIDNTTTNTSSDNNTIHTYTNSNSNSGNDNNQDLPERVQGGGVAMTHAIKCTAILKHGYMIYSCYIDDVCYIDV